MKKIALVLSLILMLCCVASCGFNSSESTQDEAQPTQTATLDISGEEIADVLRIYEESLENNITTYCEEYLSYSGSPIKNLDTVKDIITPAYYESIKDTENYFKNDESYEQATALNKLFFEDYSTPSTEVQVLAQCYQSVIVNNKATTHNAFYVFTMVYDDAKGWLIDAVDKPADTF